ncbi:MAG TPA: FadR/GntR family transcriptional regulator [Rhodocyclaceae bacterium]|nr:FadR/GntR family transcriptional regulator [Rhodocyclaceae bacterium]
MVEVQERTKQTDGAAAIRDYLLQGITQGSLTPGQKLPTERDLAERYKVPRSAARKILAGLETEGYITRAVGSGTFVADQTLRQPRELPPINEAHVSPAQIMEARLLFEPGLAELAVTNATPADFARFAACLEKSEAARTVEEFELWDGALHQAIAAATHNTLVIRFFELIHTLRQQAEWGKLKRRSLTPERRQATRREHRDLVEAILERDPERARKSLATHLRKVRDNLLGY